MLADRARWVIQERMPVPCLARKQGVLDYERRGHADQDQRAHKSLRPHKSRERGDHQVISLSGKRSPGICILDKGLSYRRCVDQTLRSVALLKTVLHASLLLLFLG